MKPLHECRDSIDLIQALIGIPSINPEGATSQELEEGIYGEAALAQALLPFLQDLGYHCILEEVTPKRYNLIARAPGLDHRPRILFGPHLDTVRVDNMTIHPFESVIKQGRISGRGATDTKGSMAAMLWALKTHAALLSSAPVALDFVAFMGEETQQLGSKHFAKHHQQEYEFAIVGEPTSLNIVHCTKGCLWSTLSTTGTAAHASQPELGDNAILTLLEHLPTITKRLTSSLAQYQHPVLEYPTWNLGLIKGGTQPNIVADHAEATLDIRTTPALWDKGGSKSLLAQIVDGLPLQLNAPQENPPMDLPPDHPWIHRIQKIHPQSQCIGAPWFSDAAHLNQNGISAICLGPGSIDQAHTQDEYITQDDYLAGVQYFSTLVYALCLAT